MSLTKKQRMMKMDGSNNSRLPLIDGSLRPAPGSQAELRKLLIELGNETIEVDGVEMTKHEAIIRNIKDKRWRRLLGIDDDR